MSVERLKAALPPDEVRKLDALNFNWAAFLQALPALAAEWPATLAVVQSATAEFQRLAAILGPVFAVSEPIPGPVPPAPVPQSRR